MFHAALMALVQAHDQQEEQVHCMACLRDGFRDREATDEDVGAVQARLDWSIMLECLCNFLNSHDRLLQSIYRASSGLARKFPHEGVARDCRHVAPLKFRSELSAGEVVGVVSKLDNEHPFGL